MKRTLLTIGIAIISMCGCFGQKMPKLHNEVIEASKEYQMGNAFQKDLLLYVDMLGKTHPYYADRKNLRKLDRDARKWYKECGKLTDTSDFRVFLETIVSSLNDGHTAVRYWDSFEKLFPFSIIVDGDSPAIINVTSEEQKEYLGKSVKSINGRSVQDILKAARPYISADNQINYETLISQFFAFADFWKLLGMSSETLTVTTEDEAVIEIPAITRNEAKLAYLKETVQKKQTAGRRVLFEYEIFENESICYLQFNKFADRITHRNNPQLPRFDYVVRDMMAEMQDKNIETLVIDLQYNGGGNSVLGTTLLSWLHPYRETKGPGVQVRMSELLFEHQPFFKAVTVEGENPKIGKMYDLYEFDQTRPQPIPEGYIQDTVQHVINLDKDKIYKGNIVFIQGRDSYSSSELLMTQARDNGVGIIVGEISGAKPCHFGDVLYSVLPNTGTITMTSCKYFTRADMTKVHEEYLVPDVIIDLDDPEKDLVWEWILKNYGKQH